MDQNHKKVAHLTELLNESELNIQRLTDQSQVLKDEIRRLEGSWDETAKNMEYLKNILMKVNKLCFEFSSFFDVESIVFSF